jgi:hypothetical protein
VSSGRNAENLKKRPRIGLFKIVARNGRYLPKTGHDHG